jgi:hypothetical protein
MAINLSDVITHEMGHSYALADQINRTTGRAYCDDPYEGVMGRATHINESKQNLSIDDICMFKKLYCPELTPVEEEHQIADDIKNYPNPLDDIAYIELPIPDGGDIVSIKIYSIFNELVNVIDKNYMSSGTHKIKFNA